MATAFSKESTFWYYLCRRTWDAVSKQMDDPVALMNIRAREEGLPLEWTRDAAISWATVCRMYLMLMGHIRKFSRWEFTCFRQGGSAAMSPPQFFHDAMDRAIGNIRKPAFADREPVDSLADTFALGSVRYGLPRFPAEVETEARLQEPLMGWIVTDEHVHKAALLAVLPEDGFWDDCLEDYAKKRPGWFRRTFTDSNKWLFPEGGTGTQK